MPIITPQPTSQAANVFQEAIKDAEVILGYFDEHNTKPPPPQTEVLKRAGLIMALTAWETYVEVRLEEAFRPRLEAIAGSSLAAFVENRFRDDIARLHNPNSTKTQKLYFDYLALDVTKHWTWSNMDVAGVRKYLDRLLEKRGDAAHRSPAANSSGQSAHLVRREDLDKAIRFLKTLVEKTELALQPSTA